MTSTHSRHVSKPSTNAAPKRKSYRAARAFYLTISIATCLALFALFAQSSTDRVDLGASGQSLYHRGVDTFQSEDEECRLVHRAKDQCAFVKAHCPDEEAGFSAYLDLFYCRLAHVKPVAFIILIAWLGLLFSTIGIAASDFFCINLSTIATILGMSESMAGVTFLAFGNGSPDVFSTFAAMSTNSGSLAVGELIGAAGFITAVVAGSMALIKPFHVARKSFVRDVGFFIVAAAFSMVFLYDGRLHLWECLIMVGFYIFYVAFVVVWHWWLSRRRRRREKEALARGHFVAPGDELDTEQEEYHDDPEERPGVSRMSTEDFGALERGGQTAYNDEPDEDEEEEARDRWMSELNSNMRLSRPVGARSRRNTLTPIRPSLVGALEFQAVLKSLQKSRNIQTIPMHARRYSDDPTWTSAQQQDQMSSVSDPAARPPYQIATGETGTSPIMERPSLNVPLSAPGRTRAVSANDISGVSIDPDLRRGSGSIASGTVGDHSDPDQNRTRARSTLSVPGDGTAPPQPQSPTLFFSPASPNREASLSPRPSSRTLSQDHLAPPGGSPQFNQYTDSFAPSQSLLDREDTPQDSPRTVPQSRRLPKIVIPREGRLSPQGSQPTSPFPAYRDDPSPQHSRPPSVYLPPPSISPESRPQSQEQGPNEHPVRWWPYNLLPPPGVLVSSLFPTIYCWHEKNLWEKLLGVVAAPSVLLLTITLPVVENEKDKDDDSETKVGDLSFNSAHTRSQSMVPRQPNGSLLPHDSPKIMPSADSRPGTHHHGSLATQGVAGHGTTAKVATTTEQHQRHNFGATAQSHNPSITVNTAEMVASPTSAHESEQQPWNRWLTIVQLFLAPIFVVLCIYSQSPTDMTPRWLVMPTLICLLVSLVLLIPLLLTTTPTHRPAAYKFILSMAGFIVSIAWISTIAAQVVGALKALAVILNMSHAIMGLTIFAVGNSLGDFVADVTVAKLGYPVMALSACFGGPMLNILLGIGLSGSYILIRGAEHRHHKHPNKEIKFRSYEIEVSPTLIVSGVTLLVTLVGLLIVVPLNKWVLSKKIGWALIALWTLSTIGNVVLEITGWGENSSEG